MKEKLIEKIAALEHEQWAHWVSHMLGNMTHANVEHWKELLKTPYDELTEEQKEKDRLWAQKAIDVFIGHIAEVIEEVKV